LAQVAEDAAVTPEQRFAANLRRQRLANGLSQEQLAEKTGLHPSEVSRLERAVREPRLGTIAKLAHALGVSAAKLVAGIK
jgi:transcriptional regulator with XRE-family HTH domain